jgi:hypothetical protein
MLGLRLSPSQMLPAVADGLASVRGHDLKFVSTASGPEAPHPDLGDLAAESGSPGI